MGFQQHKDTWENCSDCELHECRKKVVLAKGLLPCDLLFVGEAPGASEDVLGKPFMGPAGHLLDQIIGRSDAKSQRIAMTNLVCCFPKLPGEKKLEPEKKHIEACSARLKEMVKLARPRVIVAVGKLALKHVEPYRGCPIVGIIHPAGILRMDVSQRGLAIQRTIVALNDAVSDNYL